MSYTKDFIDMIAPGAVETQKKYEVLASITIAQAIIESAWGKSTLAVKHKNLFGIKADSRWNGPKILMNTAEYYEGKYHKIKCYFRKYDKYEESIEDHALFLVENRRYKEHGFFSAKTYKEQANALQDAGYATSPTYAKKLINIIEYYKLFKYDSESNVFKEIDIKELQQFLNSQGFTDYDGKKLIVDGITGPRTRAAFEKLKEVEL